MNSDVDYRRYRESEYYPYPRHEDYYEEPYYYGAPYHHHHEYDCDGYDRGRYYERCDGRVYRPYFIPPNYKPSN